MTGAWRKLHVEEHHHQTLLGLLNHRDDTGGIIRKQGRCKLRIVVGRLEKKRQIARSRSMWKDNIKTDLRNYRSKLFYS